MDIALPVIAFLVVAVGAILLARSRWRDRLDDGADRVLCSRAGWFMPGGVFWKLGHAQASSRRRYWPLVFGVGNWVLFERGRQRAAHERGNDSQA